MPMPDSILKILIGEFCGSKYIRSSRLTEINKDNHSTYWTKMVEDISQISNSSSRNQLRKIKQIKFRISGHKTKPKSQIYQI